MTLVRYVYIISILSDLRFIDMMMVLAHLDRFIDIVVIFNPSVKTLRCSFLLIKDIEFVVISISNL